MHFCTLFCLFTGTAHHAHCCTTTPATLFAQMDVRTCTPCAPAAALTLLSLLRTLPHRTARTCLLTPASLSRAPAGTHLSLAHLSSLSRTHPALLPPLSPLHCTAFWTAIHTSFHPACTDLLHIRRILSHACWLGAFTSLSHWALWLPAALQRLSSLAHHLPRWDLSLHCCLSFIYTVLPHLTCTHSLLPFLSPLSRILFMLPVPLIWILTVLHLFPYYTRLVSLFTLSPAFLSLSSLLLSFHLHTLVCILRCHYTFPHDSLNLTIYTPYKRVSAGFCWLSARYLRALDTSVTRGFPTLSHVLHSLYTSLSVAGLLSGLSFSLYAHARARTAFIVRILRTAAPAYHLLSPHRVRDAVLCSVFSGFGGFTFTCLNCPLCTPRSAHRAASATLRLLSSSRIARTRTHMGFILKPLYFLCAPRSLATHSLY